MASAREVSPGKFQILWRFRGKQHSRTISAPPRDVARAVARLEEAIQDIARGRLEIPEGADVPDFVFSGGKVATVLESPSPGPATLGGMFAAYRAGLTPGSKDPSSLETEKVHERHLLRIVGGSAPVARLGLEAIQGYADARAAEGVSRVTIGKEIGTLLVAWSWAYRRGVVPEPPRWKSSDVTRPKGLEKPPFRTWAEIERAIDLERPAPKDEAALWDRLWLDQPQTLECLAFVAARTRHPFLPPMFAFAAYTGARRSEILRSRRADWDFDGKVVAIREKKADTSRQFTRRMVDIHPALGSAMTAWFGRCPSTPWAISTLDGEPIGPRMATKYFRSSVKGSRWAVLHGWHVFRHSLASNMASSGVDPRVIDQILGHRTEEMSRRYRHLLPTARAAGINSLFGGG